MTSGTIKRLNDRGFGFISPENGGSKDVFFHSTSVEGTTFDQLREGMAVSFNEEADPRDPSRQRASRVTPLAESDE
jgi:cold shock protein